MRNFRFTAFFAAICLCIGLFACPVTADAAEIAPLYELPETVKLSAQASLVASLGNEQASDILLAGTNIHTPRSPAALVRVLVGAYAATLIEKNKVDMDTATGTYTYDCFHLIAGSGVATAQMNIGETWTVRDLLTMSMMQTAGDAVVTLAVTLAGDHASFVSGMNDLAASLGCKNTRFVNVTGLDAAGQVTTAYDLYLIMRYAISFPELRAMMGKIEYTVKPVSGGKETTWVTGNNLLRSSTSSFYAPTELGRTGYTDGAGRCLAAVASSGGYECLAVVLGCPPTDAEGNSNVQFADIKSLFKWSFSAFSYKVILSKGELVDRIPVNHSWDGDAVALATKTDLSLVVPAELDPNTLRRVIVRKTDKNGDPVTSINAPVTAGDVLGKIELYINLDTKIAEADLVATDTLSRSGLLSVWDTLLKVATSPWLYGALGALILCLGIYIWAFISRNRSRRRGRTKKLAIRYKGGRKWN